MRVLWFGLLTVLVAVFIRTPDYDSLDFDLEANKSTAGGGSTNQVSTALGFGMFLTFFAIYKRQKFSGYRLADMGIMGLFALQTLLTFSRGGMIGAVIAIATLVGASMLSKQKTSDQKANKKKNLAIVYLAAGVVVLYLAFNVVDNITGGKLTQRYQGETEGTAGGYAEKDLNRMTSGRSGIIEEDLQVWKEFPLFGSGIGASPYLRMKYQAGDLFYITPHIEISRLLAEHGLLGLIYFIILIYIGWKIWMRRNRIPSSDVIFALYMLAFISSFHSAMRTFVTPFLLSVCAMSLSKPEPKRA
jgi:O-antigen ligase